MSDLLVIVPSRGRPQNIKRLINGFQKTKTNQNTALLIAVDEDDPELDGYLALTNDDLPDWVSIVKSKRMRLGGTLNFYANQEASSWDIIGFMGDDHLPLTFGWDQRIIDAMAPGGVIYGNDLFQGPNLPTAVFMDSKIVSTLGYFVPRGLVHLFFDNTWKDWGEQTGRLTYLDDIIIEHIHPHAGKGEMDERYAEVNAPEIWGPDEARYNEYRSNGEFTADIEKLRAL